MGLCVVLGVSFECFLFFSFTGQGARLPGCGTLHCSLESQFCHTCVWQAKSVGQRAEPVWVYSTQHRKICFEALYKETTCGTTSWSYRVLTTFPVQIQLLCLTNSFSVVYILVNDELFHVKGSNDKKSQTPCNI